MNRPPFPGGVPPPRPSEPRQSFPGEARQSFAGEPRQSFAGEPRQSFPGEARQSLPRVGDTLVDKYRIVGHLGAGGMGVVFAAEHLALQTAVAVKIMLPEAASAPGAVERFVREARAAAMLRSQHVAKVLDVGTLPGGIPYLVMEHLVGRDLHAVLRQSGRLGVSESAEYLLQICEAVGEAHDSGIVHRDLKPSNLFVTVRPNGEPLIKVLDFGLAKVLDQTRGRASELTVTTTGEVIGSPHYMSPEQFRSLRNADARSDIWALGVIAYEMVCGRRPFDGEGMTGLMVAILQDSPAPPRTWRPEIPSELEGLILGCLEKRPDARVQSIREMANVLRLYSFGAGRDSGVTARVAPVLADLRPSQPGVQHVSQQAVGAPSQDTTGFGQSSTRRIVRSFSPKRGFALALGAVGALLASGLVLASWLGSNSETGVSGSAPVPAESPQTTGGVPATGSGSASEAGSASEPGSASGAGSATGVGSASGSDAAESPGSTSAVAAPKKGTLHINASPVAKVVLDGKPMGTTPKIGILVDSGKHTVTFFFARGRTKTMHVTVKPGQSVVAAATDDPTGGVSTPGFD